METWPSHLSKWPHVPEALGQRVVHVDHQDREGRRARHLFWVSHEPRCQDGARCWAWHGPSVGTPHDGYPSQFAILVDGIVAMADGLWLNILISAKGFKRGDAEKAMMQYLCQIFPKHKDAFV